MTDEGGRELKEIAAKYGVRPEEHKPVVIERDGDVVYVAMKEADFQAVEPWLASQAHSLERVQAEYSQPLEDPLTDLQLAELYKEMRAYDKMLPELLKTHKGKWVAIHAGVLVDSDEAEEPLIERVTQKFQGATYFGLVREK